MRDSVSDYRTTTTPTIMPPKETGRSASHIAAARIPFRELAARECAATLGKPFMPKGGSVKRQPVKAPEYRKAILDALSAGPLSVYGIRDVAGISRRQVQQILTALADDGAVVSFKNPVQRGNLWGIA